MAEGINAPLLFFLEEKTVSLRGKRSPLRRTSSFLFRRKEAKENHLRNSCFSALLPLSPCATQNGRFTYEPSVFPFRAGRAGKRLFSERHPPPLCLLFLFFKKRNRPPFFLVEKTVSLRGKRSPSDGRLLFFLEEKTVGLRGKRRPSDGRMQAHPALSSVGIPQRVCLPPPPCLCPCPPRLRTGFPVQADHAKENHLRKSYYSALLPFQPTCHAKRTVHIRTVRFFVPYAGRAGNRLFSERHPPPQCLLFLFFKKRKRSPLEEKKTSPFIEEKKSSPLYVPGIRLIKKLAR